MIKKVHPHIRPLFACHNSLEWIANYTHKILFENGVNVKHLWLSDNNEDCFSKKIPDNEVIDILFTGSFFLRLLELPNWKIKEMRLWTLCPDIQQFVSEVFKIPKESIGLIPHPTLPEVGENKELRHLVYAGRLSWGKNIEALLALVSYLQHHTHPELELTLYGTTSHLPEESWGRITDEQFDLNTLIECYPWKKKPTLKGNDPKWFEKIDDQAHYISLSTSMYEDFALSPSEAGLHKTPLILSGWGGHKYKEGARLLSSNLIFKSFEPQWVKKEKTRLLTNELLSDSNKKGEAFSFSKAINLKHADISPQVMSFIHKNSPEILLCFREGLETFADTFKGRNFFYLYAKYFSSLTSPKTLVFYSEENQELISDDSVLFLPDYDLHVPEVMRMKITAQTVLGLKDSIIDD